MNNEVALKNYIEGLQADSLDISRSICQLGKNLLEMEEYLYDAISSSWNHLETIPFLESEGVARQIIDWADTTFFPRTMEKLNPQNKQLLIDTIVNYYGQTYHNIKG